MGDKHLTNILKTSIACEKQLKDMREEYNTIKDLAKKNAQMAKHIVQLEADRKQLRAIMTVSAGYLEGPLQHIEDMLKSNVPLPYESLADYSKLSRFMFAAHGRKHMAEIAEKRMRELSA